ncbi:hypothetical protein L1276_004109 [Flavobacterium sp. HSC-32F16]|uniref:DUF2625 domain-containing protein n=1 Tax=Flavobacterium sp. HSC-32F16 TaxID=2910964 RepID=UPI0020A296BF|nr:DUF2625 domain-containing protein [Flavobacterium sp. HSC-32F16]MCP2028930.1 hypothetical protein [Flavobacterium sp. HSC-32F16]
MTPKFSLLVLTFLTFAATAQNKMKKAEELIDKTDPGWTLVEDWIKTAKNKVEILPTDASKAKEALYKTQVTTRSPMGAIVFNTGGLLIDDGWIRILGSGNSKFDRTLPDWNKGKSFNEFGEAPAFLLVADDAIGGFYFLNGGGLGTDIGKMYYFSPDNLEFEQLDITYSEFLGFCFNNDLDKFYEGNRWNGWREEVSKLKGDEVFNFYPFLWTAEGSDINKSSRKIIPVQEQYSLNLDLRKQLGFDK